MRDLSDSPDPGEDFNCRCWAEFVSPEEIARKQEEQKLAGLTQKLTTSIKETQDKWTTIKFLQNFFVGGGNEVSLSQAGYQAEIIKKAEEIMYHKVEKQVSDRMRSIKNGTLIYRTENSYPRLKEVHRVFGGGTIKTITAGKVTQSGNLISIDAKIQYEYYDEFTDIASMRQFFIGPHYFRIYHQIGM